MFLLFTSDASIRYKQDAIDATAYPAGHVIRFRYHETHVDPSILAWKARTSGEIYFPRSASRDALLVFAERRDNDGTRDFVFRPVRYAKLISIRRIGSAIYLAIRLSGYPCYDREKAGNLRNPDQFQITIASIPFRPIAPIQDDKGLAWYEPGELRPYEKGTGGKPGLFFLVVPKGHGAERLLSPKANPIDEQTGWEGVVESLGATSTFAACCFFRIAEIHQQRDFAWFGLAPKTIAVLGHLELPEPQYRVLPGFHAFLSCRVMRPRSSNQQQDRTIQLSISGDALTGPWPTTFAVDSRYNEQQITVATKRVLDHSAAVLTIVVPSTENPPPQVVGPQLAFLFSVIVPTRILLLIFSCFLVGPIVLSLGPDSWEKILNLLPVAWATALKGPTGVASEFAAGSKLIGAFITGYGAYVGFRRLPLRS